MTVSLKWYSWSYLEYDTDFCGPNLEFKVNIVFLKRFVRSGHYVWDLMICDNSSLMSNMPGVCILWMIVCLIWMNLKWDLTKLLLYFEWLQTVLLCLLSICADVRMAGNLIQSLKLYSQIFAWYSSSRTAARGFWGICLQ